MSSREERFRAAAHAEVLADEEWEALDRAADAEDALVGGPTEPEGVDVERPHTGR